MTNSCRKILIYSDINLLSVPHDKFIEEIYLDKDIIKNKLNCEIYLWGPGIDNEDLNWSEPLECKIEKKFGDKYYFDIIITYPGGGVL